MPNNVDLNFIAQTWDRINEEGVTAPNGDPICPRTFLTARVRNSARRNPAFSTGWSTTYARKEMPKLNSIEYRSRRPAPATATGLEASETPLRRPMKLIDLVKRIEKAGLEVESRVDKNGKLQLSGWTVSSTGNRGGAECLFSHPLDSKNNLTAGTWTRR
jgi:hypothetical protein